MVAAKLSGRSRGQGVKGSESVKSQRGEPHRRTLAKCPCTACSVVTDDARAGVEIVIVMMSEVVLPPCPIWRRAVDNTQGRMRGARAGVGSPVALS